MGVSLFLIFSLVTGSAQPLLSTKLALMCQLSNVLNEIFDSIPNLACLQIFADDMYYVSLSQYVTLNRTPVFIQSLHNDGFLRNSTGRNLTKQPTAFPCQTHLVLSDNPSLLTTFFNSVNSLLRGKLVIVTSTNLSTIKTLLRVPKIVDFLDILVVRPAYDRFFAIYTHRAPVSLDPKLLNSWSDGKFLYPSVNLFPDKLANLCGHELKITSFTYPPNCLRTNTLDGPKYSGVEISIMETLSETLNFTYLVTEPTGSELWGEKLANGTYTGLLGKLAMKESDVGFAGLYIQPARMEILDFTSAYKIVYECFAVPASQPLPQWMALYLPFDSNVWCATLAVTCLAALILYGIAKVSAKRHGDQFFLEFQTVVFYVYSNIIQAPVEIEVRSRPVRLFVIWWFVIATIVPTVYKSALTAYITIPINPPPINTLKELSQTDIAKGGFGNTTLNLLKESKDPVLLKLTGQMIPYYNMTWGYEKLAARELALTSMQDNLQYLIRTSFSTKAGKPTIHTVRQCLVPFQIGFALQKNSIYTAKFSNVIQHVVESGLVDYWLKDFVRKTPQDLQYVKASQDSTQSTPTGQLAPFTMKNLQGAFFLLAFGCGAALLVCTLEHFTVK